MDQDKIFNIKNIEQLPDDMKYIAISRFVHNESQYQVSCRLGISIKKVSCLEKLAIKKLKEIMYEEI